ATELFHTRLERRSRAGARMLKDHAHRFASEPRVTDAVLTESLQHLGRIQNRDALFRAEARVTQHTSTAQAVGKSQFMLLFVDGVVDCATHLQRHVVSYAIVCTRSALCTWSRFSAWSNTILFCPSTTLAATSSSRCIGKQCMN